MKPLNLTLYAILGNITSQRNQYEVSFIVQALAKYIDLQAHSSGDILIFDCWKKDKEVAINVILIALTVGLVKEFEALVWFSSFLMEFNWRGSLSTS